MDLRSTFGLFLFQGRCTAIFLRGGQGSKDHVPAMFKQSPSVFWSLSLTLTLSISLSLFLSRLLPHVRPRRDQRHVLTCFQPRPSESMSRQRGNQLVRHPQMATPGRAQIKERKATLGVPTNNTSQDSTRGQRRSRRPLGFVASAAEKKLPTVRRQGWSVIPRP